MYLYISTCPETGRKFLCENGKDSNIAEIFERGEKVQALIDAYENFEKIKKLTLKLHSYYISGYANSDPRVVRLCNKIEALCT